MVHCPTQIDIELSRHCPIGRHCATLHDHTLTLDVPLITPIATNVHILALQAVLLPPHPTLNDKCVIDKDAILSDILVFRLISHAPHELAVIQGYKLATTPGSVALFPVGLPFSRTGQWQVSSRGFSATKIR